MLTVLHFFTFTQRTLGIIRPCSDKIINVFISTFSSSFSFLWFRFCSFFLIEANTRERMMNDDVFFQSGESNLYIILFNNVQKNDTQQLNHKYTGAKYLLNDDVHSFTGRCYFQPIFFMFFFLWYFWKTANHACRHP